MSYKKEQKKFKLRPRARIVKTFGEELISNDYVAIIELVKNSYDADARNVDISFFEPLKKGSGKIVVKDNGRGMSSVDVQKGWMEPAAITKLAKRKSPSGRRILGEKGIGRFSAAKLAERLTLITRKTKNQEVVVHFRWSDFYDEKKYLDEIESYWETRSPQELKSPGTILLLEGLNRDWGGDEFKELQIYLSRLINPLRPVKDFTISLNLPAPYKKYAGVIAPSESMENSDYVIRGKLNNNYTLIAEYKSKKKPRFQNVHNKSLMLESGKMPSCGPINFEFRVWDRDRLKDLAIEIGSTLKHVADDLNAIAGISIFRDGFRILPYGDPRNDWLRLDLRRVQNPTMRLSNNQIVGNIFITASDNPELRDQTNREGVFEADAFNDLKEVTKYILNILEGKRYKERRELKKDVSDRKYRLFRDIDLVSIREIIEKKIPEDKEAIKTVTEKEGEIKRRVEEFRDFIVRYRRLSTLGQLVDIVLHDAGEALSRIKIGLDIIQEEIKKIGSPSKLLIENLSHSKEGQRLLTELFKRLEPFGGRKRERARKIIVEEAIKDVFEIFSKEIKDLSVDINLPKTESSLTISDPDFKLVFVNLLNNSLYWLQKMPENARAISVSIGTKQHYLEILFSDSGPGIPKEDAPFIFDPYYTKKPEGIGLGLTIVGEFISECDGTFDLLERGPLKGATFRIKLPLS